MRDAYQSKSRSTAKRRLLQLASQLASDHPDAAESLREGLDETLTLKDMGLPSALERTLSTTNSIENMNSNIRRTLRRIKRWRDGTMIKRWVAIALTEAERGFRRLRGFRGMPTLVAAVRSTEQGHRVDSRQEAA
jgi:putative transposase